MPTITLRTDDRTDRALADLTADGTSTSDAVRAAILDAARRRYNAQMRSEAEALASDPDDLAESRAVMADMDEISAW